MSNDANKNIDKLKADLKEKDKIINSLQNSQAVFLKNLSQNIRIPLNGIIGMIDVMKMTQVTEEQSDYLNIINKYGDNLIVIVNDILDYSKIIADELEFEEKFFPIHKLKNSIDQSFRMRIEGKGLEFIIEIEDGLPNQIYADEYRLFQILSNIINNAIKFTKQGAIKLNFKAVKASSNHSKISISVNDSGYGMTSSKLKQLKKELNKPTKETVISTDGLGLGLSLSQALLRLMNSKLEFESEHEKGSHFWFQLDCKSKQTIHKYKDHTDLGSHKNLSILLVEDNVLNQRFAVATLVKNGHQVLIAENGKIAFEKYREGDFDLVLMDIQMPVMDGVQATLNIRKYEKDKALKPVKIVAVTAYAMDRDRERCLKSGMDKFLAKPFKPEQLIGIIENLDFK